nr:MAG TPA: hypothetical protein [Caudoviricetes sp.]
MPNFCRQKAICIIRKLDTFVRKRLYSINI